MVDYFIVKKVCFLLRDEELSEGIEEAVTEKKFLVFGSALKELLQICPVCSQHGIASEHICSVVLKRRKGSMVIVERSCPEGHQTYWSNQPEHNRLPLGNMAIAASIMFSGANPAKALDALCHMNMASISYRTYLNIQSHYLIPTILSVWQKEQTRLFVEVIGSEAVTLGGDARCCSPGHTAKYGSYSLMDLNRFKVIHFELV